MKEKWILKNKQVDFKRIGEQFAIDPLLVKIMCNRNLAEEDMDMYLHGKLSDCLSPYGIKDIEKAAERILQSVLQEDKIAIATDYDSDGVMSAYILKSALNRMGATAQVYAPDRISEGYGINTRIIDEVVAEGATLLITCDNGIAAFSALDYAYEKGLCVIVTDHHEVQYDEENGEKVYRYPKAHAIVNPKQPDCTYENPNLCGAAVVYKLVQVLFDKAGREEKEVEEWIPFAAIATLTDIMKLGFENRILVKEGMKRIPHTSNKGLKALVKVCGLEEEEILSYHIGFVLGPCFNAAGRLESMTEAFALLESKTDEEALQRAEKLKDINDTRKEMTEEGVKKALFHLEKAPLERVIVVLLEDVHESLAGIIAGRIKEIYHRPTFVFTQNKEMVKGSGRSIEAYNMFEEILKCKELLTHFGGHPMAAGLSMKKENLKKFAEQMNANCTLTEEDLIPIVEIDSTLPLSAISVERIEGLSVLEPFGNGNKKPSFAGQHYKIQSARILGANRNVLKMKVSDGTKSMDALLFGETEIEAFQNYLQEGFGEQEVKKMYQGVENAIDIGLVFYPSINVFRESVTLQIMVKHYCIIKK